MNKQILATLFIILIGAQCAPLEDKVSQLPDLPEFGFNFYSGYLDLPNTSKSVHYIFEESQSNPKSDPVVLWLQGGPGCSGLIGWTLEHGSFTNTKIDELTANPFSWNHVANMVYFEAPVGVGFSYATNATELNTGDDQAAQDNLASLIEFFKKYPEFKNNEFYISGESYGGIYVPTLALKIVEYNKNVSALERINLRGFAVGNGVTNWNYDTTNATMEMLVTHSFVSKQDQVTWKQNNCQEQVPYNSIHKKNIKYNKVLDLIEQSTVCNKLITKFNNLFNGYNPYNLYWECNAKQTAMTKNQYLKLKSIQQINSFINGIPCDNSDFITTYFNREDVRAALHIRPQSTNQWTECANINYTIDYRGSIWAYPDLIAAGLKIWIYSGDVDGIVPYPGTLNWIYNDIKPKVTREWQQWNYWDRPAGFVEEYKELTFVLVNGAGHEVPMYKPAQAFKMFSHFLNGTSLN